MLRRILSGILVFGLLLTIFPLSAFAEGETEEALPAVEETVPEPQEQPAAEENTPPPAPPEETPIPEETPAPVPESEEKPEAPAEEPIVAPSEETPEAPEESYPRSTVVPLARSYDFSDDTGVLSDSFSMLIRELVYRLEMTRESVLPLTRTEVCYEINEKAFLEAMAGVAAVYTVRAGWDRPDQEPLTQKNRLLLRSVFLDMVCIYPVLDEYYAENGALERVLRFHLSVKSAEQTAWQYYFTEEQRLKAMEMAKDESILALCYPKDRSGELLEEYGVVLPADLAPIRRKVVESALSLVGRVNYYWGGKPAKAGWDYRWGAPAAVRAAAGEAAGSIGVWGLDCSGFVAWVFATAADDIDAANIVGFGTANQWASTVEIPARQMQIGDLVWMSQGNAEETHVGILIGYDREGKPVVCHCNTAGAEISVLDSCELVRTPREFYRQYGTVTAPTAVKSSGSTGDTRFLKGNRIG